MTDYEEKFHNMGTKINRCVGIKGELPPEPEQPEEEEASEETED
jgi:tRNA (guanine-N7-)-methyltransferase